MFSCLYARHNPLALIMSDFYYKIRDIDTKLFCDSRFIENWTKTGTLYSEKSIKQAQRRLKIARKLVKGKIVYPRKELVKFELLEVK